MDKQLSGVDGIFETIAREEGMSVKEVEKEIQSAIDEAMKSHDPKKQDLFKTLFGDTAPTPEEFIKVLGKQLEAELKNQRKKS